MIHVIADITAAAGKRAELIAAFNRLLPQVHAEPGCIEYQPAVDVPTALGPQAPVDGDVMTMVERWESLDHLMAHLDAPHMHRFREENKGLIAGVGLRVLEPR